MLLRPPPRVYATVRRDGSGEISFNGTTTVVQGNTLQEAGSLAVAMVAQKAAQWGKPLRMTAQSPIDTRVLMVHPDGHLTDAKDRWWRPSFLIAGGLILTGLGVAVWLWLLPAMANNHQPKPAYTNPPGPTTQPTPTGDSDEFGRILPTTDPPTPQPDPTDPADPADPADIPIQPTPTVTVTITTQPTPPNNTSDQTNGQSDEQTDGQADGQAGAQAGGQGDGQSGDQTGGQTGGQAASQTGGQAGGSRGDASGKGSGNSSSDGSDSGSSQESGNSSADSSDGGSGRGSGGGSDDSAGVGSGNGSGGGSGRGAGSGSGPVQRGDTAVVEID